DPDSVLTGIHLVSKSGGRSAPRVRDGVATVLVVSTGAAEGTREDTTGPRIRDWLADRGYDTKVAVVPDAEVFGGIADAVAAGPAVLITTGGTGMSPTDR